MLILSIFLKMTCEKKKKKKTYTNNNRDGFLLLLKLTQNLLRMTRNGSEWFGMLGGLFYLKKINSEYAQILLRMTQNDSE